jgi:hypothetical protein
MANLQDLISRPIAGRLGLGGLLSIAGIIGPVIFVFTEYFTFFNAEFNNNIIHYSISSLAWTRYGWVQTIGFLTWGLLVELFAAGIFFTLKGARGFGFALALLMFFGFSLLLVGGFHTDVGLVKRTTDGLIHGFAAKSIFWLFPAAAILMIPSLRKDKLLNQLWIYSLVSAVLAVVLMICIVTFAERRGWFGLFERMLEADAIFWVEVLAIWIFRSSLKKPGAKT